MHQYRHQMAHPHPHLVLLPQPARRRQTRVRPVVCYVGGCVLLALMVKVAGEGFCWQLALKEWALLVLLALCVKAAEMKQSKEMR